MCLSIQVSYTHISLYMYKFCFFVRNLHGAHFHFLQPPISTTTECRSEVIGYRVEYQPIGTSERKQLFVHSPDTEVQIQQLRPWLKYGFKVFSVGEFVNSTDPARTEIDIDGKGINFSYMFYSCMFEE